MFFVGLFRVLNLLWVLGFNKVPVESPDGFCKDAVALADEGWVFTEDFLPSLGCAITSDKVNKQAKTFFECGIIAFGKVQRAEVIPKSRCVELVV